MALSAGVAVDRPVETSRRIARRDDGNRTYPLIAATTAALLATTAGGVPALAAAPQQRAEVRPADTRAERAQRRAWIAGVGHDRDCGLLRAT
jgi:hypothetical protein